MKVLYVNSSLGLTKIVLAVSKVSTHLTLRLAVFIFITKNETPGCVDLKLTENKEGGNFRCQQSTS
ncbi:hypothetical protein LFYK43_18430 [Ligilactobacillus salitolerans]|uniref:Uncharacterized protein n=1 Tax=Ligilactobacillus salitolerans TaxID=1808352 RepID=A0A401IV23_9LACO|nr:hypothetical protein LFYK43_18430 [Ligilactobacillus salitolerans]